MLKIVENFPQVARYRLFLFKIFQGRGLLFRIPCLIRTTSKATYRYLHQAPQNRHPKTVGSVSLFWGQSIEEIEKNKLFHRHKYLLFHESRDLEDIGSIHFLIPTPFFIFCADLADLNGISLQFLQCLLRYP